MILTSLRDDTVGKTVRGVNEFKIYNNDPLLSQQARLNLHTPAAGDGGYIYFGGNSLTDYNLHDPRDGSLIDNADIRYMTRIEIQGGGIVDIDRHRTGSGTGTSDLQTKLGQTPIDAVQLGRWR